MLFFRDSSGGRTYFSGYSLLQLWINLAHKRSVLGISTIFFLVWLQSRMDSGFLNPQIPNNITLSFANSHSSFIVSPASFSPFSTWCSLLLCTCISLTHHTLTPLQHQFRQIAFQTPPLLSLFATLFLFYGIFYIQLWGQDILSMHVSKSAQIRFIQFVSASILSLGAFPPHGLFLFIASTWPVCAQLNWKLQCPLVLGFICGSMLSHIWCSSC